MGGTLLLYIPETVAQGLIRLHVTSALIKDLITISICTIVKYFGSASIVRTSDARERNDFFCRFLPYGRQQMPFCKSVYFSFLPLTLKASGVTSDTSVWSGRVFP